MYQDLCLRNQSYLYKLSHLIPLTEMHHFHCCYAGFNNPLCLVAVVWFQCHFMG